MYDTQQNIILKLALLFTEKLHFFSPARPSFLKFFCTFVPLK